MTPLFFGDSSRRLFGLYTPAHAKGGKQRGVVICPPWGPEYLRSHRSLAQLGKQLAEAGFHVLRFDYFGTGDSAGDMTDADLKGWQADVGTAVEELKDTTGLNRVGVLGLRLGATLAARAASARRKDIDTLVLWDPIINGADHMAALWRQDEEVLKAHDLKGGQAELLGFPLTDALARDLHAIDLLQPSPAWPVRTLVAVTESLPSHKALRAALDALPNGPVPMELIESLPAWQEDRHTGAGAVPVKVLQRIVEWLN